MTTAAATLTHLYEVYIRTTPEKLWQAISDPSMTQRYFAGMTVETDWKVGSSITYRDESGERNIYGEVLEVDRPRKLVHTFTAGRDAGPGEPASRVTYEITPFGEVCKLTLIHEHATGETEVTKSTQHGWSLVLSGLKTLLETNTSLPIPPEALCSHKKGA